jgi:hypothetical protein
MKVINQIAIAVFAFIICVTKVSLLVSRKVDPDNIKNPDDKAWYG